MGFFSKIFQKQKTEHRNLGTSFDKDLSKIRYNLNGLINISEKINFVATNNDAEQIRNHWNAICSVINKSELKDISPIFVPLKKEWYDKYYYHEINKLITDTTQFLNHVLSDLPKLEDIFLWSFIDPDLKLIAQKKFHDGHYSEAVDSCIKLLISEIQSIYKDQTGEESDGTDLMHKVFSPNNPILKFTAGSAKTTQSIQEGYHNLFVGMVSAFRNHFAHEIISKTKSEAMEIIFLVNLLKNSMKKSKL